MATLDVLMVFASAYFFFGAISVDPRGRATIIVGNPLWGVSHSAEDVPDPTFRLLGVGGLVWAAALVLLANYNDRYCSLAPQNFISLKAMLGAATILITAKILFGPIMHVRKSLKLVGYQKFARPFSFMIYDALIIWPSNFVSKFSWKLLMVSTIAGVVWLLSWFWNTSSTDVVPAPLAYAWIIACLGRAGTFVVHQRPSVGFQLVLYASVIFVTAVMWSVVETMLKACGAVPGVLPSYGSIVASVIGLPLMEAVVALITAVF
ncbi:hypothetical protein SAMN04487843_12963 [Methylobacterium sp. ap11]|uniref:hypothetical protein n=1 Tax=Methylobacterium sp. ap11 TaxID=1761799 RepID=UPI0008B54589|nr:hypothetical protein [Methylobacterium sp. ap11]SEP49192.1 hypothetical protein SAMN04487843_12963 [Methylobacterium sp. ap11]